MVNAIVEYGEGVQLDVSLSSAQMPRHTYTVLAHLGGKRVLITLTKMRTSAPKSRQNNVKMAVLITSKGINSAV